MVAAEAVANSLDQDDLDVESVVPDPARIREVALNVATAVVMEAAKLGLAAESLGSSQEEVQACLVERMWSPQPRHRRSQSRAARNSVDYGSNVQPLLVQVAQVS